jgi:hypothetical protein
VLTAHGVAAVLREQASLQTLPDNAHVLLCFCLLSPSRLSEVFPHEAIQAWLFSRVYCGESYATSVTRELRVYLYACG